MVWHDAKEAPKVRSKHSVCGVTEFLREGMPLRRRRHNLWRAVRHGAGRVDGPFRKLEAALQSAVPPSPCQEPLMQSLPQCPSCGSEYTYEDHAMYVCPECAHEWSKAASTSVAEPQHIVRDAKGNTLADGDSVIVIKDLKVKGSSSVIKVGTKVRNIRLVEGDHDIDCKVDGVGAMQLKSEFVRKA